MNDSVAKLVEDVWRYDEEVYPNLDPDYAAAFGARVRALGECELVVYLFLTYQDSTLHVLLDELRFAWCDIAYDTWLQILEQVAETREQVYQILWFMSHTLAIDIHRLPSSHPNVRRDLRSAWCRYGVPGPASKATRARMEDTFDYEAMWKRLAAEGAPMHPPPDPG